MNKDSLKTLNRLALLAIIIFVIFSFWQGIFAIPISIFITSIAGLIYSIFKKDKSIRLICLIALLIVILGVMIFFTLLSYSNM